VNLATTSFWDNPNPAVQITAIICITFVVVVLIITLAVYWDSRNHDQIMSKLTREEWNLLYPDEEEEEDDV
jgi:hypothetical protein